MQLNVEIIRVRLNYFKEEADDVFRVLDISSLMEPRLALGDCSFLMGSDELLYNIHCCYAAILIHSLKYCGAGRDGIS